MGFFDFGRKKKDKQVKTASRRGSGAGRTRGTRADDLADARDKRKPRGVTSPVRNAAKVERPPTSRAKPTGTDKQNITNDVTNPAINPTVKKPTVGKTALTKMPQVTGLDGRNVKSDGPSGKRKRANVTREQMEKVGLDPNKKSALTKYLNKFDKLGRRPKKSDFSTLLSPVPVVSETKNRIKEKLNPMSERESKFKGGGGVMKSKMGTKGGAMGGAKGYSEGKEVKADKAAKAKATAKKAASTRTRLMPGPITRKAPKIKGMTKNMRPTSTFSEGKSVKSPLKDMTGDGKVTQKDVLKARGVPGFRAGGTMKTKGMSKGGAMKTKGMSKGGMMKPKGMSKGGMMKPKGMSKGGAMKTKGYSKGGAMKTKGFSVGGKVRGAGIAQRGVRKAKIF